MRRMKSGLVLAVVSCALFAGWPTVRAQSAGTTRQMLKGTVQFQYPTGWVVSTVETYADGSELFMVHEPGGDWTHTVAISAYRVTPEGCQLHHQAIHVDHVTRRYPRNTEEWLQLGWQHKGDAQGFRTNGGNTFYRNYTVGPVSRPQARWDFVTYCVGSTVVLAEIQSGGWNDERINDRILNSIRIADQTGLKPSPSKPATPSRPMDGTIAGSGLSNSMNYVRQHSAMVIDSIRR